MVNVAGSNGVKHLNQEIYIDLERGPGKETDLEEISIFPDDTATVPFLDASTLPMASSFPNSKVARLADARVDDNSGKDVLYTYEFYELINGEFVTSGIGFSYDVGYVSTLTPNGTFKHAASIPKGKRAWVSANWEMGDELRDTLNWRVEVKEGFTTVIRNQRILSFGHVVGSGILYLPHDSFEVLMIQRADFTTTADTAKSIFGSQTDFQSDSSIYVQFWSTKQQLPVANVFYNNTDFDSIVSMNYLETTNKGGFQPTQEVLSFALVGAFNTTSDAFWATGITAIVDEGLLRDEPVGKLDTAHAIYTKPYPILSSEFKFGHTRTDTFSWQAVLLDGKFKHSEEITRYTDVDGYGKLYIQGDSVDVLRIKTLEAFTSTDEIDRDGNVNKEVETDSLYYMEFISKNNGLPLVKMEMTSNWQQMWDIEFTDNPDIPVKNNRPEKKLAVYPNPANGEFHLTLPDEGAKYLVRITGLDGKLVSEQHVKSQTQTFQTQQLNKGIYLIQAYDLNSALLYQTKVTVE